VLRPGGILAMLWSYEDEATAWVSELASLIGFSCRALPTPPELRQFSPARVRQLRWSRQQDVAALPDYALSHSGVATLPNHQRAGVLAAVSRLATDHPDLRGRSRVEVPMQLVYWSYRRTPTEGSTLASPES
jgi:hypothetical protein